MSKENAVKQRIKHIHHQLNNELAKLIPVIEIMAEDSHADHSLRIQRLPGVVQKILAQTEQLSEELHPTETHGLFHLSYASQWVPSALGIKEDIERILTRARPFNQDYGITGLLVFQANHFIQYLEGDLEDIYTVYGRICMDPRHKHPTILSSGPIVERNFLGWDMGSYVVSPDEDAALADVRTKFIDAQAKVEGHEVLSYMNIIKGHKLKRTGPSA